MQCHLSSQMCGTVFKHGRLKEFFLPTLGNIDCGECDHDEKDTGTMKLLSKNEKVIAPSCGCHSDCCACVFVKAFRKMIALFPEMALDESNDTQDITTVTVVMTMLSNIDRFYA